MDESGTNVSEGDEAMMMVLSLATMATMWMELTCYK